MEKIRVLHLISSSGFFGAERVVVELCKKSRYFGIEPSIGVFIREEALADVFCHEVSGYDIPVTFLDGASFFKWKVAKKISDEIKKNKITILHSHGYKSDIYAFIVSKCYRQAACLIATNHNWIGVTRKELIYQFLDCMVLRYFDSIIAVSENLLEQLRQQGLKADKLSLINNGIDVEDEQFSSVRAKSRQKLNLPADDFIIGCVARLTKEKAHIDLIYAFSEFVQRKGEEVKLLLIGDGPELENLRCECRNLDIMNSVLFLGNREDVRSLYSSMDVFALASTNEGLPMVLLEAMASNLPVVATRIGAIPKVIEHRKNGLLVPPSNRTELFDALWELHESKALRNTFGGEARKTVLENFSNNSMAEKYSRQYEKIMELKHVPFAAGD